MIKNEGPTLYKLPQQLHRLLSRECLLYLFTHIGQQEIARRKKHSIATIQRFTLTLVEIREFLRRPRKMMCPEFAASILQHAVISRIRGALQLRLITLRCHLRKVQRVIVTYHHLAALVKSSATYLFDFLMLTQYRVSKGCSLERVVPVMIADADSFRRIRFRPTLALLVQPLTDTESLHSAKLSQPYLSELPVMPYSKHQY